MGGTSSTSLPAARAYRGGHGQRPDNRSEIRDFLATRRARITPEQVGLPTERPAPGSGAAARGGRRPRRREHRVVHAAGEGPHQRRVRGRPRRGRPGPATGRGGAHLPVRPGPRRPARPPRAVAAARPSTSRPASQWLLDSMTLSAAFVTNGRLDIVAANALARALYSPMFDSETTDERGRAELRPVLLPRPRRTRLLRRLGRRRQHHRRAAARRSRALPARQGPARTDRRTVHRSAPSSAPGGPPTTSVSTTAASSVSTTLTSGPWNSPTSRWTCPSPPTRCTP